MLPYASSGFLNPFSIEILAGKNSAQRAYHYALHALTDMYIAKRRHVNFYHPGNRVLLPGRVPGLKPASRKLSLPISRLTAKKPPGRGLVIELVPGTVPAFLIDHRGLPFRRPYSAGGNPTSTGHSDARGTSAPTREENPPRGSGSAPAHSGPWRCRNTGTAPHN